MGSIREVADWAGCRLRDQRKKVPRERKKIQTSALETSLRSWADNGLKSHLQRNQNLTRKLPLLRRNGRLRKLHISRMEEARLQRRRKTVRRRKKRTKQMMLRTLNRRD